MHLHAALVPPPDIVRAVLDAVRAAEPAPTETPDDPAPRRRLFGRRTEAAPAGVCDLGPLLDVLDEPRVLVPITDFGYVTAQDRGRLVGAVAGACRAMTVRTVRVSGGAALVEEGDRSVWAQLQGDPEDLAALRDLASGVVAGVEPVGFFCDRRQFRARFAVATINDLTTVEHLERVLAVLDAFTSDPWRVDAVAILQRPGDRVRGSSTLHTLVPIGEG